MSPLWAIVGATGTGKTRAAIELANEVGGEVVSVDSAQVFIGMDIGTAKPSATERAAAVHHLIDVITPDVQWSAAAFADAATAAIEDVRARGLRPILCGGAGLWYRALTRGIFAAPEISPAVRGEVRDALEQLGSVAVHAQLAAVDPTTAERLHPNDGQRIGRALEVFRETGLPISAYQDRHGFRSQRHEVRAIALDWDRDALSERLDTRAAFMFSEGLLEETQSLLATGYAPNCPGLRCIGYAQSVACLRGEIDEAEALRATQVATRRYAKRQRNWFRHEAVAWLPPTADVAALIAALDAGR